MTDPATLQQATDSIRAIIAAVRVGEVQATAQEAAHLHGTLATLELLLKS